MLSGLERVRGGLESLSRYAVWVGGAAMLLAAVMVAVDVIARKYFGVTMSGSDEISGYVFAASTTWAYSFCLLHRSHIRIDALYNQLPVPVRAVLDMIGLSLLLLYVAVLTRHAWTAFITSYDNNAVSITTLATPLWIPQLFWILGLGLFVLTLVFMLFYAGVALAARNFELVTRLIGIRTIEEELEEETVGVDVVLSRKAAED